MADPSAVSAPVAAKTAWQETRHGEVVTDDYRWMHKKEQPEVIAHLNAENAYTEAQTAAIKPLAAKLYGEIKGRMQDVDLSVPTRRGAYYYYSRFEAGKQYPVMARRHADAKMHYDAQAAEEVLLDQNVLAEGQKFFAVGAMAVSHDGGMLLYSTDTTGYRQYTLQVKDLEDRQAAGRQRAARDVGGLGRRQQDRVLRAGRRHHQARRPPVPPDPGQRPGRDLP
ncbi:hypothetical protein LP420_21790 [Massilia sp. B-10]|nr:hypothetical protein LP420_21790 [Massilia sp. B-10]